jgi:hypothetical protein
VGLIIVGIVTLVTMIATAATSVVALTQAVQNSHYVNNLTKTVTYALEAQVQIDDKMDAHLNILEAVIITLDNELDVIKY